MPNALPLILAFAALGALLILALADRFATDEAEHPTHDSTGNVR